MPDDSNLPPMSSDLPNPAPEVGTQDAPQSLTFTPEQLSAMGLDDCQEGSSYTVTFTCTGHDEAGCQAAVESAGPAGDESAEEVGDLAPASDEAPEAGESPFGFSRKPKAPRAGLPDTKKLREV